ncbi:MAG: energy transducer TonB, partial [Desulfobulbaceae bacterium]|nr:energy transducer TonB [Desulfobulbaceae bacterium]
APKPAPRLPEEYLAQVRTQVEARKFYPSMARQLKMQGTVVVAAAISRDGVLRSAEVRASSGSQQLDHAAVKAVMHASPFAAPADFGLDAVTVDIPLTFKLL